MGVYENVKEICRQQNISIRKLERAAGFGNGTIGAWRYVSPKIDSISKVAKTLNVPINAILYGKE